MRVCLQINCMSCLWSYINSVIESGRSIKVILSVVALTIIVIFLSGKQSIFIIKLDSIYPI